MESWLVDEKRSGNRFIAQLAMIADTPLRRRPLEYQLMLYHRDNIFDDGQPNRVVRNTQNKELKHFRDWKGPIVATGSRKVDGTAGKELEDDGDVDLTPSALGHIMDYFNMHLTRPDHSDNQNRLQMKERTGKGTKRQEVDAKFVTGVHINCELDMKLDKRSRYEIATIPSSHDIFNQSPIDISVLVKLPIVVQKLPGSLVECFRRSEEYDAARVLGRPWLNQRVAFLHRDCLTRENTTDVEFDERFGVCPPRWDKNIGTVIAMRLDKKPLYPEHIAALAGFSQIRLSPYFQKYRESWYFEDDEHLPKSYVVQEMTRFKLGQYYDDWREVQMNKERLDPSLLFF